MAGLARERGGPRVFPRRLAGVLKLAATRVAACGTGRGSGTALREIACQYSRWSWTHHPREGRHAETGSKTQRP